MVRHTGIFSQVVSLFNRNEFARIVKSHDGDKHSKGFTCWDQFVSMLFCQFDQAKSLREISDSLSSCVGKFKNLGMRQAPKRSTLSYANANRSWEIYRDLFYNTLDLCRSVTLRKHKFRFKNELLSLTVQLFPFVCRYSHVQSTGIQKALSNYIFCLFMTVIYQHTP